MYTRGAMEGRFVVGLNGPSIMVVDRQISLQKTLYQIVICLQFHLEGMGFTWKLLDDKQFTELCYTLDNIMKERVASGIGIRVKKADIISVSG